ncbi:MAG TPA: hypothetical protein VF501_10435 [Thiobacillus sp.]
MKRLGLPICALMRMGADAQVPDGVRSEQITDEHQHDDEGPEAAGEQMGHHRQHQHRSHQAEIGGVGERHQPRLPFDARVGEQQGVQRAVQDHHGRREEGEKEILERDRFDHRALSKLG